MLRLAQQRRRPPSPPPAPYKLPRFHRLWSCRSFSLPQPGLTPNSVSMKRVGAALFVAAASSYAALKVGASSPSFTAPNSKASSFIPPSSSSPVPGRDDRVLSPQSAASQPASHGRDDGKDDGNQHGFNFFTKTSGCDCKVPGGLGCWHRIMSLHEIDQLVNQQVLIAPALRPRLAALTPLACRAASLSR